MYQRRQMPKAEDASHPPPESHKKEPSREQTRTAPPIPSPKPPNMPHKPSSKPPQSPPKQAPRPSVPFLEKLLPNMDSGDLLVLLVLLLLLAEGNEESSPVITTLLIFLFLR